MAADIEKRGKGFAGLDSMVSDVEVLMDLPPEPENIDLPPVTTNTVPPVSVPSQSTYDQRPSSNGPPWKAWAFAIGVALFIILISTNKDKTAQTTSYTAPAAAAPAYVHVPEPSPVTATNEEQIPPVGRDLSFNPAQIRYCLSEDIRMSAWKEEINNYSESSVDAFNMAVSNYNMRCSSFRYRRGMLESVRAEVEANRHALQLEGKRSALANP